MRTLSSRLFQVLCGVGATVVILSPEIAFTAGPDIEFPQASQPGSIKQRIGLTDVEIDSSRPNKNGRQIFGGLLPYGTVWRTGANASTKIKFSDAIKFGGQEVAAGQYALYTIPTEGEWTIILSKDTKGWGAYEYKTETDALRVTAKPVSLPTATETFTISFGDLKDDGATLYLEWDTMRVPVMLATDTVEKLDRKIETALKHNPKALGPRFYYDAASFYYAHDRDLEQALKWIDLAIVKKPIFYSFFYKKAQIEAKLGHKTEARAAAEKSIELLKSPKAEVLDEPAIRNSQMLIDSLGAK